MPGAGESMDGDARFYSTGRTQGARNQSYPLRIRMKGATEISMKL